MFRLGRLQMANKVSPIVVVFKHDYKLLLFKNKFQIYGSVICRSL